MRYFSVVIILFYAFSLSAFSNVQVSDQEQTDKSIDNAIELMFAKDHAGSLELLIKSENLSASHGWKQQQFRATLNIGANYYLMSDYGEALKYYLRAYELAIEDADERNQMIVINNIAILYFEETNLEQALTYFTKAYSIAHRLKEEERIGFYAVNIALVSNKLLQLESARMYLEEALPFIYENERVATLAKMAQVENLFLSESLAQSQQFAEGLLPQLTGPENKQNKVFILNLLSQIEEKNQNIPKAISYARMAANVFNELDKKEDAFHQLVNLYTKNNNPTLALHYKDSVLQAVRTIYEKQNSTNYENSKIKFELQTYSHELQQSRLKHLQEKRWFIAIGVAILCVFLAIVWLYRNNAIKFEQRKQIAELKLEKQKSHYLIKENQLKEKEAFALLEQQRLQNELEVKNRKLTAEALYLSNRNELIEEVINTLTNQKQIATNPDIKRKVLQLKKHLKKDEKWKNFNNLFEEINYDFLKKLQTKHPNLTITDVQYLSYLYMNLSNKEIAAIINISPDSCRKRKERISKKINLPKNASLYSYLLTL